MNNRLSIIEVLEQSRKTQGLTQDELAKRAGTSRITVGRVEAGFDPKLSTVYEMARALGLELTLVPKALAGEVQAFLRSGGRSLAQPQGASAPPSVVELAGKATSVATARPCAIATQGTGAVGPNEVRLHPPSPSPAQTAGKHPAARSWQQAVHFRFGRPSVGQGGKCQENP